MPVQKTSSLIRARKVCGSIQPWFWTALLAAIPLLLVGRGYANYDTTYSLVWGSELAHGQLPDYSAPMTPTPHPLATLVGVIVAPFGSQAEAIIVVVAFLLLGSLGYLTYRLGASWFSWPIGLLAATIILTREPILSAGVRSYIDIPYTVLLLSALVVESRRPRAGWPVLALIGLAGLLRPEAWLIGGTYWLYYAYCEWWRARHNGGSAQLPTVGLGQLTLLALLTVAPTIIWLVTDQLLAGAALHSFVGTRANGATLHRVTGLAATPITVPRRLGEILREPVFFGAAGGGLLALSYLRGRARLAICVTFVALVAFVILAAFGLPIVTRYLFFQATLLAIFCGVGAFGWLLLPKRTRRRRSWMAFGVLTLLALIAFIPQQHTRITNLRTAIKSQVQVRDDLTKLAAQGALNPACGTLTVPNYRPIPILALWLQVRPATIRTQHGRLSQSGHFIEPSSATVANSFLFDQGEQTLPHRLPPAHFAVSAITSSWKVYRYC